MSADEYVAYLQIVTPRIGDATKELREKTKGLSLDDVIIGAKAIVERGGRNEG